VQASPQEENGKKKKKKRMPQENNDKKMEGKMSLWTSTSLVRSLK
jgi:hypothetical protein